MSALINSVEHALAVAASDVVKTAKFVETSVLPVLKQAQANQSTIESITSLVSPSAANIERAGFAVLGVVINALDAAGTAAGANGLNVSLDAQQSQETLRQVRREAPDPHLPRNEGGIGRTPQGGLSVWQS
jgi:hypothetical protein